MDIGNDVDLSNKNITPLWRRRTGNYNPPQDSSKPRPLSYHINGVMTTDFPVEDNKCSFTLSQPAERLAVAAPSWGKNTVVLKHILHKPSRKSRVIRSISIGHLSNGLFSLAKFRSEDSRSTSLDNRVGNVDRQKTSNGHAVLQEKHLQDPQKCGRSWKDPKPFEMSAPSSEAVLNSSPVLSPRTANNNNNNYNSQELSSLSSASSPSPPARRTPTPSHSSTSSIPSLSSLTSSDPPTPRSPSPADRGHVLLGPSSSSQDTRHASFSSSISSTSLSPSLSPSISPSTSVVLSTHSLAARKMGTQQLIPKGLASDVRQSKGPPPEPQGQGLTGMLGLDHSKRALKALSMVETGSYFSTGGAQAEGTDGEAESPGTLKRGLRSTSYRRAVVSGVDLEVPSVNSKAHRLSQPVLRWLDEDKMDSPVSPASPGTAKPASPGIPKPPSPGTPKLSSPVTPKLPSPGTPKLPSPGTPKLPSPGTPKLSNPGTPKLSSPGTPKLSSPGTPKLTRPGTTKPTSPGTPKLAFHKKSKPTSTGENKVGVLFVKKKGFEILPNIEKGVIWRLP
ncbi:Rho guanine nucleotide exchange factor 26 [Liparis tanakae]|uniref:Rho guanine nucleotide exchange factor 26 n=1 Tax=Liparis tanakae TaxID=230148 RepID=A0A4Z2IQL9_9TELE|nr:Rho guanine nucleotide exchange factor 26 [Liparis tanakae]